MNAQNGAPRRRRSITADNKSRQIRVSIGVELDQRLRVLSARYHVAVGTLARAAIEAGLKAVAEQCRRAARSAPRQDPRREDTA